MMLETSKYGIDVVIESPRDQRTLDYLVKICGTDRVKRARADLLGQRRPYVSNLAKVLGVHLPDELSLTSREDAQQHLSQLKAMLRNGRIPE
ncbi:cryptic plasmid protein A [Paraburkholderia sp. SG-MS1]|uniref:cryptic plasmid protein A n=1 Tax=Paraburkholderia sp. SG-MS1 TaxID=2023741 RepID=UPI001EEC1619|nr:cryptic plasmid protein A [Paraburkholderia sp. SG-MS1]